MANLSLPCPTIAPAEETVKTCTRCNTPLPISSFHKNRNCKNGIHPHCKNCVNANLRANYHRRGGKHRFRKYHLRATYGITENEYNALLAKQGGVCAMCHKTETTTSGRGTNYLLAVDHCHKTGKVRGLLCNKCNRAIASFHDDTQRLRDALAYLERP